MKSLQDKYNLIKEGKGNKELFIKEARTLFPNVVTGALTFDQSIHNLTERGIISENFTAVLSQKEGEPNWFEIFNENTEKIKSDLKKTDKSVEEKEIAGYDYEDKKSNNNISTNELLSGYYVEMKDPKNADKTEDELKKIVFKNLEKDPLHYIKDGAFGIKGIGYTEDHPGLGPTKEVTGKYKSSGMEPVKLNESTNNMQNKETLSEAKKRAIEKHLAEIDKLSEVAMYEYKATKIQEKIEELKNRLTMTESDDMKDVVDKKAISEIKKDIALLEKRKKMYEAQKAKAAKKVAGSKAPSEPSRPTAAGGEEIIDEAVEAAPVWQEAMRSVLKKKGY